MSSDLMPYLDLLFACPFCAGKLHPAENHWTCTACRETYPILANGQVDLRLKKPKPVAIETVIAPGGGHDGRVYLPLNENPDGLVNLSGLANIPIHINRQLITHIPAPRATPSLFLDIGCGNGVHRPVLEHIGHTWIGMDYSHAQAPMLGDIQALPFGDQVFDGVMAMAMIHEVPDPKIAVAEMYRVLKPGGVLIGTAPFLEPYYHTTYHHLSHMGVYQLLKTAGFKVQTIAPSPEWHGLTALAEMALFPRLPGFLARAAVWPLYQVHRWWWKLGYLITRNDASSEPARIMRISGGTDFVAEK